MMKWDAVIKELQVGKASEDGFNAMCSYASNWFRCAVGERLELQGQERNDYRGTLGSAIGDVSRDLHHIGSEFPRLILYQKWAEALECYEKIGKMMDEETVEKIRKEYYEAAARFDRDRIEASEGSEWFDR